MADWTALPNSAVGVGGIPTGTTVTALRDNPVAIAEGAEGAPRVQDGATALKYVRRTGGEFMTDNMVFVGWDGPVSRIRFQVDATPLGFAVTSETLPADVAAILPSRLAALPAGSVGTQGFFRAGSQTLAFGATVAGSALNPASATGETQTLTISGTWRCLGRTAEGSAPAETTLFERIA